MPQQDHTLLLIISLLCLSIHILHSHANPTSKCSKNTTLAGFESQFVMVQHQLRGIFNVLDDCSFNVTRFDMLQGSDDVHWWGAFETDFGNLSSGFVISDDKLNRTYQNNTVSVHLRKNVSWDMFNVVAVWDILTASDFGHVVIRSYGNVLDGLSSSPAPSPSVIVDDLGRDVDRVVRIYEQPTMFENCKVLSPNYRIRWTLKAENNLIDIGLEAAQATQNYMAFGWANPNSTSEVMLNADVAVTGFTEEGMPFADDYYINRYSECFVNKDGSAHGVCPDTIYENSDPLGLVNNTRLMYGHRKDGVSFIRYQRPLESVDRRFDLRVNYTDNMTVIWALGVMRPPDTLRPYYLPQNHGASPHVTYGHFVLNVSDRVNECLGPLDAEDKEDQDLIIADGNVPLVVVTGPALHYSNPPNPSKVLYINKKEAPVLRVERGVPVKFSIQAGHDVALYITSDLIGGNATTRNSSETIYAGGLEAEGVPASPYELVWEPDRNTPDKVYYQSLYAQKMGWRVQVVDGGLSDMYNSSVLLDDQQVTFFWTLSEDSISIAARGEKKSGYVAIGFGSGMLDSFAYVGWIDESGKGRVNTYWIDGKDALNVHPTNENLTYVRCKSESGIITLEFTRLFKPSCKRGDQMPECNNIIDPTYPLKVIWAMGARWTDDNLGERNMHYATSTKPVLILLQRGSTEAEQDLQPVLAVHGVMMFLAWGILLPGGVLAARYLKHVKGDAWYHLHVYLQYSGLAIIALGFIFAVAELHGFYISSSHVKFGITAIVFACAQPINAYMRPQKPFHGEETSPNSRRLWEYFHVIVGRSAIVIAIAALLSGLTHLGERYGGENIHGLKTALIVWFVVVAFAAMYFEYCLRTRTRNRTYGRTGWVLDNSRHDECADFLGTSGPIKGKVAHSIERLEVRLEPMNR